MTRLLKAIDRIYERFDGPSVAHEYHQRHGTASMNVLTVITRRDALKVLHPIREHITDKTVVEIGAGIGTLAMETARIAKQVWAIEADPAWTWAWMEFMYAVKPPNLSWIFGSAESVSSWLRADLAIVITRSGAQVMVNLAQKMAKKVALISCREPLVRDSGHPDLNEVAACVDLMVNKIIQDLIDCGHDMTK